MSNSNHAIVAKARTMYGKRITQKQYDEMLHCRTVAEVATYLKTKTHFSEALQEVDSSNIHRGHLENLLRRAVFQDYVKLYSYISNSEENLFHYVVMKEEISEILRMILLIKGNNPQEFIIDLPSYLVRRSHIDLMGMSKVTKFEDLVILLGGTDYEVILRKFQPTVEQPYIDYVGCEHALYEYYYRKLFAMVRKNTSAYEARQLKSLVRLQIEILNLERIYRARSYLDIPKEELVRSIFPYYYKLSAGQLEELIACKDQHALNQIFSQTKYYKTLPEGSSNYIEDYTKRYLYHVCCKGLHFFYSAPVIFYSYYNISQIELKNVINIIEGIRYQVSEQDIKQLIIQS